MVLGYRRAAAFARRRAAHRRPDPGRRHQTHRLRTAARHRTLPPRRRTLPACAAGAPTIDEKDAARAGHAAVAAGTRAAGLCRRGTRGRRRYVGLRAVSCRSRRCGPPHRMARGGVMKTQPPRSVTLLIPGLFGPALAGARAWEGMSLPALERWLTRAARSATPHGTFERSAFALFGAHAAADADVPTAAVTRQWDCKDAGGHSWLRADPVHVRADRDRLVMIGNAPLTLSAAECAQLAAELTPLFGELGWQLDAVNARRWYLRLSGGVDVRTPPLLDAVGQDVLRCMPQACVPADGAEWLEDDTPGAHLVVLDGARECVQLADVEGWQRFMQSLHEAWLEPLYEAVKRRIVGDATLYPADGSAWCLDTRAARRWWVRPRPLTVLAPSAHALASE